MYTQDKRIHNLETYYYSLSNSISVERCLTVLDFPRRNREVQSNLGFFRQGMSICSLSIPSLDLPLPDNFYRVIRLEPIIIVTSIGSWAPTDIINIIIHYIFDLSLYTPPIFDNPLYI